MAIANPTATQRVSKTITIPAIEANRRRLRYERAARRRRLLELVEAFMLGMGVASLVYAGLIAYWL